jgi:murein DD-endopeptidase MepM/ murein hydrolase activator NlpD
VLTLLLTTVAAGPQAAAAPPKTPQRQQEIGQQLRTLQQQVEEASAEESDVLARLDATASRRRQLDARLGELDGEIARAQADLDAATSQLGGVEGDLRRASAKLADTEDGLERARRELVDRAVDAYVRQPSARAVSLILERGEFRDLAATQRFLQSSVAAQRHAVQQYRTLRGRLEEEQAGLTVTREQVSAQRAVVNDQRDALLAGRNEQADVRRQVAAEEGEEKRLLADVRTKVKDFETQIAALKRESDAIAAFLRARQTGRPMPAGNGVLARPVAAPITSGFGPRRHPIFGTVRMHTGVDFGALSGTPIGAASPGTVVWAGERSGYGNTVIVDHGGTLATLYAHQSRIAVKEGQAVNRGQTLGYVGSTGFSTGPHLHFEVRVNGNPVDPMRYL